MKSKIITNFIECLSALGLMCIGGFLFILFADALTISYSYMGLYCLGFAAFTFCIVFPYYMIKRKHTIQQRKSKPRFESL